VSQDSSVSKGSGYVMAKQGLISSIVRIFLFATKFIRALGIAWPPIPHVLGPLSPGLKWLSMKLTPHLDLVLVLRMWELYFHSPIPS